VAAKPIYVGGEKNEPSVVKLLKPKEGGGGERCETVAKEREGEKSLKWKRRRSEYRGKGKSVREKCYAVNKCSRGEPLRGEGAEKSNVRGTGDIR